MRCLPLQVTVPFGLRARKPCFTVLVCSSTSFAMGADDRHKPDAWCWEEHSSSLGAPFIGLHQRTKGSSACYVLDHLL